MLARCATYALDGIQARRVVIECDVRPGLPSFSIVGLADTAARSLRETVRAAVLNAGYDFPSQRVTLNIAPASLRTSGPSTAFAAALALLAASGQVPADHIAGIAVYGELSLGGEIRPLAGTLAAAVAHSSSGASTPFLHGGAPIAYDLAPITSRPVADLRDVVALPHDRYHDVCAIPTRASEQRDFADIRGHAAAVFALTVAAVGGHHLMLRGAPGTGAVMLARRMPTILPPLTDSEEREIAVIRDAAGLGEDRHRPFRAPHHTISAAGLVGGGSPVRPGEVTLAHRGVLMLSDLGDFSRSALEAISDPLVSRQITLVRGQRWHQFPADFQLIATAAPCPCGQARAEGCICDPETLARYRRRLSAPLLDRLSMIVDLSDVDHSDATPAPSSADLRDQVSAARERRAYRDAHPEASPGDTLSPEAGILLDEAYRSGSLSVRGRSRVLEVAASIADLAQEPTISDASLRTALGLRGDLTLGTTAPPTGASVN